MKIISWNVNGIRACAKKGLEDFLDRQKPDAFLVQETKAFQEQANEIWKTPFKFKEVWHPAERKGYSGVANFFREVRPKGIELGMGIKKFDQEGRVLVTDLGRAYLLNMYFPNGAMNDERHYFKMDFLDEILSLFKRLDKEKPLILAGDYNIAHTANDIHDPVRLDGTSGFLPEEREWMDQLVSAGFTDVFRYLHPDRKDEYSWWSYRQLSRQRNKGWRIDYFFVSNRLAEKVKGFSHLNNVEGSDHCPLMLEIAVS